MIKSIIEATTVQLNMGVCLLVFKKFFPPTQQLCDPAFLLVQGININLNLLHPVEWVR